MLEFFPGSFQILLFSNFRKLFERRKENKNRKLKRKKKKKKKKKNPNLSKPSRQPIPPLSFSLTVAQLHQGPAQLPKGYEEPHRHHLSTSEKLPISGMATSRQLHVALAFIHGLPLPLLSTAPTPLTLDLFLPSTAATPSLLPGQNLPR
jgi:hypothetical protein